MANSSLGSPHDMPDLHNLPDLIIDKILRHLPTQSALQVSFLSNEWQGAVSSWPSLNFNEDDDFERHNLNCYGHFQLRHRKFINFLKGYVDYLEKFDQKEHLDKLSLHMRMYGRRDSSTITKWLKYASQRGLKELDISTCSDHRQYETVTEYMLRSHSYLYRFPWGAIASAKSLTSLKLEYVRVPDVRTIYYNGRTFHGGLFPCLKTLSFKSSGFSHDQNLNSVQVECPSIEFLSLTGCSIGTSRCYVRCTSLKYLEVKDCQVDVIQVDQAFNLESFTFVSLPESNCEKIILNSAFNLRYIDIYVDEYIGEFSLLGCHRALDASIVSQGINRFEFIDGYLSADVFVKAKEGTVDQATIGKATILVRELLDQEWIPSYSTNIPRLVTFLGRFSCCKKISLYNQDVEALTIPKHSLSPLPKTCTLKVRRPPLVVSKDEYYELAEILQRIAPYASIWIKQVDVEEDRRKVHQRADYEYGLLPNYYDEAVI